MFLYHQIDTLSQMKGDTSFLLVSNYVWTDLVPSTNTPISDCQELQILQKSACLSPWSLANTSMSVCKNEENVCMWTWKRENMYLRKKC